MSIQPFTGGSANLRQHLNRLVEAANQIANLRGDSYIKVTQGPTGYVISLSFDTLLVRLPKVVSVTDYNSILLGTPTGAYTSGATITLNPCDSAGVDNGLDNVTVQAGWTITGTTIPTTAIIPYQKAADGLYYALGQLRIVVTDMRYTEDDVAPNYTFQKKIRYDFGVFTTTESDWITVTTAVDCTA